MFACPTMSFTLASTQSAARLCTQWEKVLITGISLLDCARSSSVPTTPQMHHGMGYVKHDAELFCRPEPITLREAYAKLSQHVSTHAMCDGALQLRVTNSYQQQLQLGHASQTRCVRTPQKHRHLQSYRAKHIHAEHAFHPITEPSLPAASHLHSLVKCLK